MSPDYLLFYNLLLILHKKEDVGRISDCEERLPCQLVFTIAIAKLKGWVGYAWMYILTSGQVVMCSSGWTVRLVRYLR